MTPTALAAQRCAASKAAARLEHSTRAADELHLTHGAVSLGRRACWRRSWARPCSSAAAGALTSPTRGARWRGPWAKDGSDAPGGGELRASARQQRRWASCPCASRPCRRRLIPRWPQFRPGTGSGGAPGCGWAVSSSAAAWIWPSAAIPAPPGCHAAPPVCGTGRTGLPPGTRRAARFGAARLAQAGRPPGVPARRQRARGPGPGASGVGAATCPQRRRAARPPPIASANAGGAAGRRSPAAYRPPDRYRRWRSPGLAPGLHPTACRLQPPAPELEMPTRGAGRAEPPPGSDGLGCRSGAAVRQSGLPC